MEKQEYRKFRTITYDKVVEGEIKSQNEWFILEISCEGRQICFDLFPQNSMAALSVEWFAEKLFDLQASKVALGQLWQEKEKPDVMVFQWHLEKFETHEKVWYVAGIVRGHPKLLDLSRMRHSSPILNVRIDDEREEVRIETQNTVFHAPLDECDYQAPGSYEYLPSLETYRQIYEPKQNQFEVEDNTLLLVFSDRSRYYFRYGAIKQGGILKEFDVTEHIGMFQDSCLIFPKGEFMKGKTDIRYFPHPGHIEFYSLQYPSTVSFYVENRGDGDFYIDFSQDLVIRLRPGERKLFHRSSTMPKEEGPTLMGGDLYPAGIILPSEDDES